MCPTEHNRLFNNFIFHSQRHATVGMSPLGPNIYEAAVPIRLIVLPV